MNPEADPTGIAGGQQATATAPVSSMGLVDVRSGNGLSLTDTRTITRDHFTNVILFAGTADCGKTTLLASLYLAFHKKPFAGYAFAGSNTLVGFEKRVTMARVSSDLEDPDTERTKKSEFLHLVVRDQSDGSQSKHVLLCDLVGEDFREARDSTTDCKKLVVIRRADAFVLLIDGAKLATLDDRQQAKSDPLRLLRNCLDCQMLAETATVDVLITKWDAIQNSPHREEAESYAQHVQDELVRMFSHRIGSMNFFRVAAHPKNSDLPFAYGLDAVFRSWVERPTGAARKHHSSDVMIDINSCEYDRYVLTTVRN